MAINELIASGGTPLAIENPLTNALRVSQLRASDLKSMDEERQITNRNMLNEMAKKYTDETGKTDYGGMSQALTKAGNWDLSQVALSKQKEQRIQDLEQMKQRQMLRNEFLQRATTPEQVMQWHLANHADTELSKELTNAGINPDDSKTAIAAIKTPGQLEEFKAGALLGSEKYFNYRLGEAKADRDWALANEKQRHDIAMENRQARLAENATNKQKAGELSPDDESLLGSALNEGRLAKEDVNNPTLLKAALSALRQDPKVDIVKMRDQRTLDNKSNMLSTVDEKKREAAYPKMIQSRDKVNNDIDSQIKTVNDLLSNEKGVSGITGRVDQYATLDVLPDTRRARAAHNNLVANSQISALNDMRAASEHGGALGNTSDADMKLLREAATKLDLAQTTEDYKKALEEYKDKLIAVKKRTNDYFNNTYAYKGGTPAAIPADHTDLGDGFSFKLKGD